MLLHVDLEYSLREQVSAEVNKFHSNIQQVITEQFNNSTTQVMCNVTEFYVNLFLNFFLWYGVCACVRACVRACVGACVRACVNVYTCTQTHVQLIVFVLYSALV